jgi:hypothetical protein
MTRPAGSTELAWLCLSMAWPLLSVPTAGGKTMQEFSAWWPLSYLSAADFGATNSV